MIGISKPTNKSIVVNQNLVLQCRQLLERCKELSKHPESDIYKQTKNKLIKTIPLAREQVLRRLG